MESIVESNGVIDKQSSLWKPSIEDREERDYTISAKSSYIRIIYTASKLLCEINPSENIVMFWEKKPMVIFRRIYINLVARIIDIDPKECAEKIISIDINEWNMYRYEIFHFLKERFESISKDIQDKILDKIQSITESSNEDNKIMLDAYNKNKWFQSVKDSRNNLAEKMYQETLSIMNVNEDKHPDLNYHCETRLGYRSGLDIDNFSEKKQEKMIEMLVKSKGVRYPDQPSQRGLAETIQEYIHGTPENYIYLVANIGKIPLIYFPAIIDGFSKAWIEKKIIPYERILFEIDKLLDDENFKSTFINNENMANDTMITFFRFMQMGTFDDTYAFNPRVHPIYHSILRKSIQLIQPDNSHSTTLSGNAHDKAVNEPRGVLFETAIILALRESRLEESQDEKREAPWEKLLSLIEEPLKKQNTKEKSLHSMMGFYYQQFLFLNKNWFFSNLNIIAPIKDSTKQSLGIAFMQGFCYVGDYNSEMYKKIRENGLLSFFFKQNSKEKKSSTSDFEFRIIELVIISYSIGDDDLDNEVINEIIEGKNPVRWNKIPTAIAQLFKNTVEDQEIKTKIKNLYNA